MRSKNGFYSQDNSGSEYNLPWLFFEKGFIFLMKKDFQRSFENYLLGLRFTTDKWTKFKVAVVESSGREAILLIHDPIWNILKENDHLLLKNLKNDRNRITNFIQKK